MHLAALAPQQRQGLGGWWWQHQWWYTTTATSYILTSDCSQCTLPVATCRATTTALWPQQQPPPCPLPHIGSHWRGYGLHLLPHTADQQPVWIHEPPPTSSTATSTVNREHGKQWTWQNVCTPHYWTPQACSSSGTDVGFSRAPPCPLILPCVSCMVSDHHILKFSFANVSSMYWTPP